MEMNIKEVEGIIIFDIIGEIDLYNATDIKSIINPSSPKRSQEWPKNKGQWFVSSYPV